MVDGLLTLLASRQTEFRCCSSAEDGSSGLIPLLAAFGFEVSEYCENTEQEPRDWVFYWHQEYGIEGVLHCNNGGPINQRYIENLYEFLLRARGIPR